MIAKAFFYTNVLVYAAVGAGKDEPKRKRASVQKRPGETR
jgi:hypothetical protein